MIADGTKDAKIRAEKIAENAGGKLGKLKKASTGVIQITHLIQMKNIVMEELSILIQKKKKPV